MLNRDGHFQHSVVSVGPFCVKKFEMLNASILVSYPCF